MGERLLLAKGVEAALVDVHELPGLQGKHAGAEIQLRRNKTGSGREGGEGLVSASK